MSIAKSVRASLTMNQNPWPARINSGIFVVAMAVQIITRRGTAARRVHNPASTSSPQTISNVPTKCAVNAGCGNPMRAKRSTPIFASVYLRMPALKRSVPLRCK